MAKKKSTNKPQVQLSPANYIKQAARKVPIYKVYSDYGTYGDDEALAQFLVVRKKLSGNFILGMYLIDTFCLGLKSTGFQENFDEYQLDKYIRDFTKDSDRKMQEIEPNLAFNIIYGAIEYAEDLGLEVTHKDFAVTEYILPPVDDIEYVDITFGKDGKPYYFAGPRDNVAKIMATLNKNVGAGNFNYLIPVGSPHLFTNEVNDVQDIRIGLQFNFDKDDAIDLRAIASLKEMEGNIKIEDCYVDFYPDEFSFQEDEIETDLADNAIKTLLQFYEKSSHTNMYAFIPASSFKKERNFLKEKIFTGKQNRLEVKFGTADSFIEHFPAVIANDRLAEFLNHQTIFNYFDYFYDALKNVAWNENFDIELGLIFETPEEYGDGPDIFAINIKMTEKENS